MVDAPPLLAEALAAHAAGLAVWPPRQDGTKRPDGQWAAGQQARPDEAQIRTWYANGRTGLGVICGAVSGNLELLELDHPAAGLDRPGTWRALLDAARGAGCYELLEHVALGYAESTPSGGMHLLYRCDAPVEGNQKLAVRDALEDERTAEERDAHAAGHRIVRVVFETRGEGGYVVLAPSHGTVHPTGGAWRLVSGSFASIVTIGAAERAQLLAVARSFDAAPPADTPPRRPTRPATDSNGASWMDATVQAFNDATSWPQILEPHGWSFTGRHGTVEHWCRPGKAAGATSATVNANGTDRLILWSSSVTIPGIECARGGGHAPSYDRFSIYAGYRHGGDRQAAAETLRKEGIGPEWSERQRDDTLDRLLAGRSTTTGEAATPPAPATLPEVFWNARPVLEHIRQAARARLLGPDAVLGAVLARVAALTPHTVEVPGIVGKPCGLTFYATLVGPPSAGKSASADAAGALLPAPASIPDRVPLGSGEGFIELLFEMVEEPTDGGKTKLVKKQTRYGAIFHVDEGQVLGELASRSGTTLIATLRSAFTHGTLGQANASVEKRRILDGRLYVYGITLGLQPELAGPLLEDVAGGLPQRFLWLDTGDPQPPEGDIEDPGPIDWTPPNAGALEGIATTRGGWRRHQLDVDPAIAAEIKAARRADLAGNHPSAEDGHRNLLRLKVAALLALLDGRLAVEGEDWALADIAVATSAAVRAQVKAALGAVRQRKAAASDARVIEREERVADSQEHRALASAARSVARMATRHLAEEKHFAEGGGCTQNCMTKAIAGRYRRVVSVDEVIDEAIAKGWIRGDLGRFHPGESRPA